MHREKRRHDEADESRVKIALIIPSLTAGGAERVVSVLANEWSNTTERETHLITFTNIPESYLVSENVRRFNALGGTRETPGAFEYVVVARRIRNYILSNHVDYVVSFLDKFNVFVLGSLMFSDVPVFVCERNSPWRKRSRWLRFAKRCLYPFAKGVVVQTHRAIAPTRVKTGARRVVAIPNPIAPLQIGSEVSEKQNVILNVGRLVPQKNQAFLLEAFARSQIDDWSLAIAGSGPLRNDLVELAVSLGVQDKVIFVGQTNDIGEWYRRARIFCLSSDYEGFPNALLEAMSFGLACVSTDCDTGPRELLGEGAAGLLVKVGDREGLSNALCQLVSDERGRREFGEEAHRRSKAYHSSIVAERFFEVLLDSDKNKTGSG